MKSALTLTALACATLTLAACNNAETPEQSAAPETPATMPEGQNETTGAIEPSIGDVTTQGGGIPGASTGNPAAAPAATEQTPQ
ncbi:hypothetical protein [Brevundimonas variabilis]|uniref:Lipoprotein n=1 Tax=Brevundimonas variabilis TaxID=74312 RepID=A0A7W9CF82_9CAUL|nr:hypothetical protein [Brevundimonas variabilis]MBB5744532.1 hypothetical protein [Brevundimonas variabilis]